MKEGIETNDIVIGEANSEVEELQSGLAIALEEAMGKRQEPVKEVAESDPVEEVKAEEPAQEKEEEKNEEQFPLVPKDWSEEEKERFESALANPELKEAAAVFTERYDSLKKGFYKKADETATLKKDASAWGDVFDSDTKGSLEKRGVSEQQYTKQLLHVDRQLSKDPAGTIKRLMEGYKVTPEQLGLASEQAEDNFYDSENKINQLEKEIAAMKSQGQQAEAAKIERQEQSVRSQMRDFKFAIDDNGDTLYPLFEDVKTEMSILLDSGKATTLEEAYNKSPTVREKQLDAKAEANSKRDLEADRKKVKDARRASRTISTKSSAPTKINRRMTIEEHLREGFKAAGH